MALTGYAYKDALMLSPDSIAKFFDGEDRIIKQLFPDAIDKLYQGAV